MPTIYDVAKRAGVSTYTVSSVINKSAFVSPELTARVEKAVLDLDYTPNAVARSLQTRNTQTIGMLIPDMKFDKAHTMALVAIFGTTISPYLFFWQAGQEVEEQHRRHIKPLCVSPRSAGAELKRIRTDTLVGMGFSHLVALFIIIATAATLHANGVTEIESAAQAAQALRPIAGDLAFALFAIGIIGTGMLAVPVLAGSAAYAVSEAFGWVVGLDRKPREAKAFYGVIALATLGGVALNFIGIDPMKALYWAAVVNGLLAPPLMFVTMLIASNPVAMGGMPISRGLKFGGWLSTAVMTAVAAVFLLV